MKQLLRLELEEPVEQMVHNVVIIFVWAIVRLFQLESNNEEFVHDGMKIVSLTNNIRTDQEQNEQNQISIHIIDIESSAANKKGNDEEDISQCKQKNLIWN